MNTAEYLDKIKEINGFATDAQIAKALKVSTAQTARYRNLQDRFGPEIALQVARLTGVHPAQIAVDMMAARARNPHVKALWEACLKGRGARSDLYIMLNSAAAGQKEDILSPDEIGLLRWKAAFYDRGRRAINQALPAPPLAA